MIPMLISTLIQQIRSRSSNGEGESLSQMFFPSYDCKMNHMLLYLEIVLLCLLGPSVHNLIS